MPFILGSQLHLNLCIIRTVLPKAQILYAPVWNFFLPLKSLNKVLDFFKWPTYVSLKIHAFPLFRSIDFTKKHIKTYNSWKLIKIIEISIFWWLLRYCIEITSSNLHANYGSHKTVAWGCNRLQWRNRLFLKDAWKLGHNYHLRTIETENSG